MPYQIFIVEDHPIIRDSYASVLAREADLSVCGMAGSAEEALMTLGGGGQCDLVVVDVSLPGMDGIELVGHLLDAKPDLPVLVISGHDEAVLGDRARAAGARAYLSKENLASRLADAIRRELDGIRSQQDEG